MPENTDQTPIVGRFLAYVLAALIGTALALYQHMEPQPPITPPPASGPSVSPAATPTADPLLDLLETSATRSMVAHDGFGAIVAARTAQGHITLRIDPGVRKGSPSPDLAPGVASLCDHINNGDFTSFGWAITTGASRFHPPDYIFIEVWTDPHTIIRRRIFMWRKMNDDYEFGVAMPCQEEPADTPDALMALHLEDTTVNLPPDSSSSPEASPGAGASPSADASRSPASAAPSADASSSPAGASPSADASSSPASAAPSTDASASPPGAAPSADASGSPAGAARAMRPRTPQEKNP